jgi:hypothetical protein
MHRALPILAFSGSFLCCRFRWSKPQAKAESPDRGRNDWQQMGIRAFAHAMTMRLSDATYAKRLATLLIGSG